MKMGIGCLFGGHNYVEINRGEFTHALYGGKAELIKYRCRKCGKIDYDRL